MQQLTNKLVDPLSRKEILPAQSNCRKRDRRRNNSRSITILLTEQGIYLPKTLSLYKLKIWSRLKEEKPKVVYFSDLAPIKATNKVHKVWRTKKTNSILKNSWKLIMVLEKLDLEWPLKSIEPGNIFLHTV